MPLYLDVHNRIDALTSEMAAEAHKKDLAVQGKYGVSYIRYWHDEGTGKVFCLCTAPSREAAAGGDAESAAAAVAAARDLFRAMDMTFWLDETE